MLASISYLTLRNNINASYQPDFCAAISPVYTKVLIRNQSKSGCEASSDPPMNMN